MSADAIQKSIATPLSPRLDMTGRKPAVASRETLNARKRTDAPQKVRGWYLAVPKIVMDSEAYKAATSGAKALLLEVIYQHNGRNNGSMQLTAAWLKERGYSSPEAITRAKNELLALGLIYQTRYGGLNNGASRYALPWHSILDFRGLDEELVKGFKGFDPNAQIAPSKSVAKRSGKRSSSAPDSVNAKALSDSETEAEMKVLGGTPTSESEHNSIIAIGDAPAGPPPRPILRIISGAN